MIPENICDYTYLSKQNNFQQGVDDEEASTSKHHKSNHFVTTALVIV